MATFFFKWLLEIPIPKLFGTNTTEVQHMPVTIYKRLEKHTGSEVDMTDIKKKNVEIYRDVRRTEWLILQDRKHSSTPKTGAVC